MVEYADYVRGAFSTAKEIISCPGTYSALIILGVIAPIDINYKVPIVAVGCVGGYLSGIPSVISS